jgi:hypothetical protein
MVRIFRELLRLYPPAFRQTYGDEMILVLFDAQAEIRRKSFLVRLRWQLREIAGLLSGALEEHMRSITGSYEGELLPPRRFKTQKEFRFPKATVGLMTVVLIAVVMVIEKAKAISMSVPPNSVQVGPIQPEQYGTVSTFVVVLVGACAAAAIGWAILFALRRTGSQRLSELDAQRSGG